MKKLLIVIVAILLTGIWSAAFSESEQRVVRVGAFNYYPGIFKDTDGIVKGFYVDALKAISDRENIRFEYVYGSWSEGLERVRSGEVDILTSVAYTPERAEFLDYATTPLLTVWGELYAPLASELDGIRQVEGKRIAVMKSDVNARHFIELTRKFGIVCEFVELPDFEAVFKAIAAKSVDAGVVNSTFGAARQKEFGLRSTGVVFNPFDIYFAVAKGKNQGVLALLDRYLADWRHQADSPYNLARQKWSHGSAGMMQVIPRWLSNMLAVLAIATVIALGFVVLLKRKVRQATADIKRNEEILRESEAKFRSYINSSPDGIFVANENGRYVEANPSASAITGYLNDELLKMSIQDLTAPSFVEEAARDFATLKATGAVSCEHEFVQKSGQVRWWSVDAVKLSDTTYLGFTKDITERKQALLDVQNKNAEIEQFIYTVSHDLRSPLVTIKTFLGYLVKDIEENNREQLDQDLHFIHSAADKMKQLLDELLDMSRIGRTSTPTTEVKFHELVAGALDSVAGQASVGRVDIRVSPANLTLHCDRRRLMQIWQNLIDNAIKYMGDQSVPCIELGVSGSGADSVFYVRDNGIGIEPAYHEKIFGIFEQLDRHSGGVGMGLTMVKRIVELYGGRIWVESPGIGKGSCFRFTLPDALTDKSKGPAA